MVMKRSMKRFNQEAFLEDLSKVPFSTAYVFDDPDDVVNNNYTSTPDIDLSHVAVDSMLSLRKSNPIEVCEVMKRLKPI
ncbi:unnamed protein product [Porites lobata]|uniref:Uncharacterized protein n=1 Tax=Porites lobata TaxID=104759 RepID=A0ABN8PXH0_9CNID|nr:unnamed protein product [Porites lobata]